MTAWYLLIALLLLVANGFFVAVEFALIASRQTRIEQLASEGSATAVMALKSIKELSLALAGSQLGITMCSVGLGFIAEPAVARLIESGIESFGELSPTALHTISFIVALTIVTFFHMVIGEMAPKNIAIAQAERSALVLAVPFRIFVNVFRPIVHVLNAVSNLGTRLLGVEPRDERVAAHTVGEIGTMIKESAESGLLKGFEQRLLSGAARFGQRDAASAMVPRTEVVAIPLTISPAEIERVVLETGHSRLPVYSENLDQVHGFFHAKDLLRISPRERERPLPTRFIRPMLVVPESLDFHTLLFNMRRERKHFALVIDEHGGTAGIVTLEDVLEELVGEISDEHDAGELGVEPLGDQRYLVPGTLRIDEAGEHLEVELPHGEYETVAGFLMDRLGRIPKRRDVVQHDGWRLRVQAMQGRRVAQVLIEPASSEEASPPRADERSQGAR